MSNDTRDPGRGASGDPAPARRRFLKQACIVGGTATAAAAIVPVAVADAPVAPASSGDESPSRGYRETEHIKRYYELAGL